jgi:ribosome recycling factor
MNQDQIINDIKQRLEASTKHFGEELKKLRTGRAHASMLDGVMVEAYGSNMPIIQVATVTAPEAQLIQITPFDPGNLQAIATAIRDNQSLGLNPVDDGHVVRIQIPPLTSERREQIVKQLKEKLEESLISMRGMRHEALKSAEGLKQKREITEDDYKSMEKQVDEAMAKNKSEVEQLAKTKETDIMTV